MSFRHFSAVKTLMRECKEWGHGMYAPAGNEEMKRNEKKCVRS